MPDGNVLAELGPRGNFWLGGHGQDGDVVLFPGKAETHNTDEATVHLDARGANLKLGGNGVDGDVVLYPSSAQINESAHEAASVIISADEQTLKIQTADGNALVELGRSESGNDGDIFISDKDGNRTIHLGGEDSRLWLGGHGNDGDIFVTDKDGNRTIHLGGEDSRLWLGGHGNDGDIFVTDKAGNTTIRLNGDASDITLHQHGEPANRPGGGTRTPDSPGDNTMNSGLLDNVDLDDITPGQWDNIDDIPALDWRQIVGSQVTKLGGDGRIVAGGGGTHGKLVLQDPYNNQIVTLDAEEHGLQIETLDGDAYVQLGPNGNLSLGGHGQDGDILINDKAGNRTIHLDGDAGDIILHNADCAEEFPVASMDDAEPGTVMVIEEGGMLIPCAEASDSRLIGVISGAGDYQPAIVMGRDPNVKKSVPIAMNGKVFCKATASGAPIRTGDLLTTSSVPGHAMCLTEPNGSVGAVLGKALAPLASGQGLIPILVMLR